MHGATQIEHNTRALLLLDEDDESMSASERLYRQDPVLLLKDRETCLRAIEELLWIENKTRQIVPLVPNSTQRKIIGAIYDQIEVGKPVRLLDLKPRQHGSSTIIGAYNFLRAVCEPNTNALIASEEKQGSAYNLFEKYERFVKKFPVHIPLDSTRRGHTLELADPLSSNIRVVGEKSVTSFTYQMVHLSEAAFFSDLRKFLAMLSQTVPNDPSTAIIIETTANRYGDAFHEEWLAAEEGKNDYYPLFLAWYEHEEYQAAFETDAERDLFRRNLGHGKADAFGDEHALLELGCTLEQLNWRRWAIKNNCQRSVDEFNRQYPTTAQSAFLESGRTMLDVGSLTHYLETDVCEPKRRGYFSEVGKKVKWHDDPMGIMSIWRDPLPYQEFVIGSDHAEGLSTGDYNAAIAVSRMPFEQVATIRGYDGRQVGIKEFAEQLYLLARYFNDAWVCPENAKDGGTVCYALTETYRYHNVLAENVVTMTARGSDRYGWNNNGQTRKRGVGLLQTMFTDREMIIHDRRIIDEGFQLIDKNGKAQAARKGESRHPGQPETGFYDDLLFSLIGVLLALEALPAARPIAVRQAEAARREVAKQHKARHHKERGILNYV